MDTLTNTINSKVNCLNLDIEELLYTELSFITNQIKYDFRQNSLNNLSKYIEKSLQGRRQQWDSLAQLLA